ncbi:MAG: lytic murein transglycosylase [Nitratireductor sp.]|nr:lytic murein transglycosylase [Nitratireductor sp.]MCC0021358.1 lytic murein transglycosylase [Nitratireductor sp.]
MSGAFKTTALAIAVAVALPVSAHAVTCSNDGANFQQWKRDFTAEYGGRYKASTMKKFNAVNYNTSVIKSDRNNKAKFKGTFESFYERRSRGVAPLAAKKYKTYKRYFDKAEKQFGVPAELILAIWGLETAFGRYSGNIPILEATATLAYDCRRSESLFFPELLAALTVIDNGYADLYSARGAFHGEIGQTQFLPSRFLQGAIDYDGGGVDVFRSPADVIGSTSKWFAANGWQAGGDYQQGSANYRVIMKWNAADNYQMTIPRLAAEIRKRIK